MRHVHNVTQSTGLTLGTIASVFGLTAGIINQLEYSILVGVVILSAVVPTFIAQKWFMPAHSEDIVDLNGDGKQGAGLTLSRS